MGLLPPLLLRFDALVGVDAVVELLIVLAEEIDRSRGVMLLSSILAVRC